MKGISVCELRSEGEEIQRAVKEGTVVLTRDGKPFGMVIRIDENTDLAELDRAVVQARGLLAMRRMQERSVALGLDKMTLEEINAEIQTVRREMQSDRAASGE